MLKITRALLGVVALAFLSAGDCLACDCPTFSAIESFKFSDYVFSGSVVRVQEFGSSRLYTFKVERSLKGDNPGEVVIRGGGSSCDFDFIPGDSYMVYARKFEGQLYSSICSGTVPLPESRDRGWGAAGGPAPLLNSEPNRSFGNIALVTGLCVLLSLSVGLLVRRFRRRAA